MKTVVGVPTGEDDNMEAVYGLGDLADLTVNNEADPLSYNVSDEFANLSLIICQSAIILQKAEKKFKCGILFEGCYIM